MKPLILCVDDEADICRLLDTILTMSGYRTLLADTAGEALARARARPNLVLLDINLPDMDGIEVCRRLRQQDPRVPVLFLTAATNARRREAMTAGGSAFLEKPFDVDELLDIIEGLLARGHERRSDHERRRRPEGRQGPDQRSGNRRRPAWGESRPGPASNPSVISPQAGNGPRAEGFPMARARPAAKRGGRSSRGA